MPDIIELCHALQAKHCTEAIWRQIQIKYAAFDGDIDHDQQHPQRFVSLERSFLHSLKDDGMLKEQRRTADANQTKAADAHIVWQRGTDSRIPSTDIRPMVFNVMIHILARSIASLFYISFQF